MKTSQLTTSLLTLSLCAPLINAFPLFIYSKRTPQPQASYSVVPVGGVSSTSDSSPTQTQTITSAVTQTQTQTLISTITVDGETSPTTIVTTQVVVIPTTIVIATATETETMLVAPSVTSSAYDNGLWHTTYYAVSTASDVLVPVETLSAAAASVSSSSSSAISVVEEAATTTTSTSTSTASTTMTTTSIDWATVYGTARATPVNGSWWGH